MKLERLDGYYEPTEISIEEVKNWLAAQEKKQQKLKENQEKFDDLFVEAKALIQECYAIGGNFLKENTTGISVANENAWCVADKYNNFLQGTLNELTSREINSIDDVDFFIKQWNSCVKSYQRKIDEKHIKGLMPPHVVTNSREDAYQFGEKLKAVQPFLDLGNLYNTLKEQQKNLVELDQKSIASKHSQDALLLEFKKARKRIQSKFPEVRSAYYYRLNALINNESKYLDKNSKLSTDVIKNEWNAISESMSEGKYPEAKDTISDVLVRYDEFLKIAEFHNQNLDTISSLKYYEERRNTTSNNSSRAEPEKSKNESQQSISNNFSTVVQGSDEDSKAALLFFARYGSDQTRNYFAVALAALAIGLAVAACCFVSPVAIGFFAVGSVVAGATALCLPFEKPAPIL